ncbi:MAG TPA: hypothetical protein DCS87_13350 [Rheinheimera sp.]|nr:hypothetical protein [Rheinheimera sp.]
MQPTPDKNSKYRVGTRPKSGLNKGHKFAIAAAAVGLLALFFNSLPEPEPRYEGDFVVGPVTVFQDGRFSATPLYVTVDDGVISAISAHKPDLDVPFITAEGGTLLPGLTDAHVHTYGNALEQQLRAGVTSVLDMFMAPDLLKTQLKAQSRTVDTHSSDAASDRGHPSAASLIQDTQQFAAYQQTVSTQATLYSAGVLATSPKGHGTEYGIAIPTISSPEQADSFVRERIAEGSAYLKIVYQSDKAPYNRMPSIDQATLHALVDAAHQHGLKAVVHIADQVSAQDAVNAGADGLVHSFFDSPIKPELLRALVDRKVFVIPTLAVYDANIGGTLNQRFSQLVSAARPLTRREQQGLAPLQLNRLLPPNLLQNLYANVRAMHDAGVVLLAGTDAPNGGTLHGLSLQAEMLALREVGLSTEQALLAASRTPLRQFGIEDRGDIAVGQQADLVLLAKGDVWQQLTKPSRIWHQGLPVSLQHAQNPTLSAGVLVDFSEQAPGSINTTADQAGIPAGSVRASKGFASVQTDARFGGKSTIQASIVTNALMDENVVGVQGSAAPNATEKPVGVQGLSTQSSAVKAVPMQSPHDANNPVLQLNTQIDPQSPMAWAGFSWVPFGQFNQAADLSAASKLTFRIKGDAGTYRLLVISGEQMVPTTIDLSVTAQWQEFEVNLAEQTGVDVSAVKVLLWSAPAGQYQWQLDAIALQE